MSYASIKTLAEYLDVSESGVHALVAQGKLPPPLSISERIKRWRLSEVDEWLNRGNNGAASEGDMDHAIATANLRRSNKRVSDVG